MRHTKKVGFALALAAGCAGSSSQLVAREGAVHDALTGLGFSAGTKSEASLNEGGTMQFPLRLARGECRAFVALGSSRIRDLSIDILRSDGLRVARDENHARNATTSYCATSDQEVEVVVTALEGHGEVTVSSYTTTGPIGGRQGGYSSSCTAAETLELGASVSGSTAGGRHTNDGSCISGGSPEIYYQLTVAAPTMVSLDLRSDFDSALYVLRECGSTQELGCNDDYSTSRNESHLDVELDAGTYIVVVDGWGGESGNYELSVRGEALAPLAQVCSEAAPLTAGTEFQGTTEGAHDRFRASCAGGGRSPDRVHSLAIAERSRVRLVQTTPNHDGALFLRRSCEVETSEIACSDDWNGIANSVVTTVADPGTYYVYTDAYSQENVTPTGRYTLRADVVPAAGTGGPSDTCETDVAPATGDTTFSLDTIAARDDYQGSCGGQGGADVVRRFRVAARSSVRVVIDDTQFEGVAYIRRAGCDGAEVACRAFTLGRRSDARTAVEAVLDAGDYVLVIDGSDVESFGSLGVSLTMSDVAAAERICRAAPLLTPGRDVRGTTVNSRNSYEASCAGQATSPDQLYRLVLRRRSFVQIHLEADAGFDCALHMRQGDCSSLAAEVACNDDFGDVTHSMIEGNFDAGTYYVIVDGYSAQNSGGYRIRAEVDAARPNFRPSNPDLERTTPGESLKPITLDAKPLVLR